MCSLRENNLEKFEKVAQEKSRRPYKHFQKVADGKGTSVATKPTLFSTKGWFEIFKMCFSWQKVQLIGTSRPAVYLTADDIFPKLQKFRETEARILGYDCCRACGRCQLHRLDSKSRERGNERVRRETDQRSCEWVSDHRTGHFKYIQLRLSRISSIKLGGGGGKELVKRSKGDEDNGEELGKPTEI